MWTETKQKPLSGGGTATWTEAHNNILLYISQGIIWPPVSVQSGRSVFVVKRRIPDLHAGAAWTSDDFDAPLPEDFLIGDP